MTTVISHLYDTYPLAREVVSELEAAGLPHTDISLVAGNADNLHTSVGASADSDDRGEGTGAGAGIGALLGGGVGLLTGLGLLAIPGIGPVVAAGWLVATAAGAAAGGATGGLIGALTQAGASKEEAEIYAEGVRRGGTLVTARVPDDRRDLYQSIMDRTAVNLRHRAEAYREAGWDRFDAAAEPYTAEQARRERDVHSRSAPF